MKLLLYMALIPFKVVIAIFMIAFSPIIAVVEADDKNTSYDKALIRCIQGTVKLLFSYK